MASAPAAQEPPSNNCNQPVYMVVSGQTHDSKRMQNYAQAIFKSGLYQKLGGYYINNVAPVAVMEGKPEKNHATLIVRFPCLANAQAFWYSKEYQENIKPLRLNPSAGDYTVFVFPEVNVRADMVGKVGDGAYKATFDASQIEQVKK